MSGMSDRDTFAAAALTGLLVHANDGIDEETLDTPSDIAYTAYQMADAMLRERCRSGGDCPGPDNAPNHDAAPEATAPEPEPSAARRRPAGGTGDTQSFDAYARFAGTVMNWISEATSAYAASCSSDGGRKIMADACCQCWDAFDRIAYPTIHGASPEARARTDADRGRTDKADSRPGAGAGDTPATHATPGEGSEQRECTEPVAWAVMLADGTAALHTSCTKQGSVGWKRMMERQGEVVPLYRKPTLTDAEAETLRELRDEAAQYADEIGLCASEVRGRQRIIDGLLVRLGGER